MKVRKFRQYLESAAQLYPAADAETKAALNAFLTGLRRHDRESVDKALGMFFLGGTTVRQPAKPARSDADAEQVAVADLRATFEDDAKFREALEAVKANRLISREGLNRVFCELFSKTREVSAKTTRAKIAQDIADLRLERVRSKKAAQFFAAE